jgi:signal transduction histidine kinase
VLAERAPWDPWMIDQPSKAALGAVLAAAAGLVPLMLGLSVWRGGLLVSLLAVLLVTRWRGRAAGLAATAASGAATAIALAAGGSVEAVDFVVVALVVAVGAGMAVWISPHPARETADPETGRLKEEFLATVSHELRTPLNAILGWTELLRMPRALPSEQVDRGLEVIDRNARRQLALVEELLAATESGVSSEHWEPVDVRALLQALVSGLTQAASIAAVQIEDEAAAPSASGGAETAIRVQGDAQGLRLALRHVLDNAIRFTPAGGQVRTRLRRAGGRVLIFISDTGPGIDPSRLAQVFEPFRQDDGSTSRPHGGLGLGLTIARRLIERHGGHLDLRSDRGGGATFLITLPALAD